MKCRKHDTHQMTGDELKSDRHFTPRDHFSCHELAQLLKAENSQNYYPHCKSQASIICCWQNSSLCPNQSLNNLATPAELKRTTKAAKVWSKPSLIWNLSAAPCSCLSDCAFFFFFYRMRTPVAAVTQTFVVVFFFWLNSFNVFSKCMWDCRDAKDMLMCSFV